MKLRVLPHLEIRGRTRARSGSIWSKQTPRDGLSSRQFGMHRNSISRAAHVRSASRMESKRKSLEVMRCSVSELVPEMRYGDLLIDMLNHEI